MADSRDRSSRHGVEVRTDLIEAFIFRRRGPAGLEFLQMKRCSAAAISAGTWQPVHGHIEAGETAVETAVREMAEETGLTRDQRLGLWQLEQVHPFYVASINAICLTPRFAAEVGAEWEPTLNAEHECHRWVDAAEVDAKFLWPGQRVAIRELIGEVLHGGWPTGAALRLE